MKKGIFLGFLIVFSLLVAAKTVSAIVNFLPQFGGRVINTTALEIQALEWAGFQCAVPGSTISIAPLGSPLGTPISYLIPFGIYSKTGYSPMIGQLIIGKYNWWKTTITCTHPAGAVQTVWLDTVGVFGNSRY